MVSRLGQDAWKGGLLSCLCLDGTQGRPGSLDGQEATRCGAWVEDTQDTTDAESRQQESRRNTNVSEEGHQFADKGRDCRLKGLASVGTG